MKGTPIVLEDGLARAEIWPTEGGSVRRYDLRAPDLPDGWLTLFETAAAPERSGVFAFGMQVLVPWANRISRGGFVFEGDYYRLEPNIEGERFPNHGNGFQSVWTVVDAGRTEVSLELVSDGPGPFRYAARLSYRLEGGTLGSRLTITNRSEKTLPFGGGFHPWFPRTRGTSVAFSATGYFTQSLDHLPQTYVPMLAGEAFELPDGWVNTAFSGWDGSARVIWPEAGRGIEITAEAPLRTLMVYSPSADCNYVCLEPVSHSVDAHNRDGPGHVRPQALAPGQTLELAARFAPFQITI